MRKPNQGFRHAQWRKEKIMNKNFIPRIFQHYLDVTKVGLITHNQGLACPRALYAFQEAERFAQGHSDKVTSFAFPFDSDNWGFYPMPYETGELEVGVNCSGEGEFFGVKVVDKGWSGRRYRVNQVIPFEYTELKWIAPLLGNKKVFFKFLIDDGANSQVVETVAIDGGNPLAGFAVRKISGWRPKAEAKYDKVVNDEEEEDDFI